MKNKRIIIVFLLLITTFLLSACESSDESYANNESDLVYLNISSNNSYGIKTLKPGSGRYAYNQGVIAEIEFFAEIGYEFIGWTGEDRDKVIEDEGGKYIINMNKDNNISLNLKLLEFMPLSIIFNDNTEIDYSDNIINVPHNLEILTLKFNNKVNEANDLIATISPVSDSENEEIEELEPQSIEIEDNQIILNWKEDIFFEVREDDYFEFGKEYKLILQQSTGEKVFDGDLNEVKDDIEINFIVEEPFPETPQNVVLEINDNNNIEISWLRSKTNDKIDIEEYVELYRIYKYINKNNFDENEADEVIEYNVTNPNDNIILRKIDQNIDISKNDYSYRIQAVNEFENKSRLSEVVSTE